MQADDDDLWKSIVDNYGDRAELGPDTAPEPPVRRAPEAPAPAPAPPSWDDAYPDNDWTTDRFVPPSPPPLPMATRDRLLAWSGLFGAPAVLIVLLLIGVQIPSWGVLLLVAAFVAGFGYLVVKMSREPRDPGDDGARL